MTHCRALLAAMFTMSLVWGTGAAQADDVSARAQASRAAIKELASRLKGELVQAIKAGGSESAISVCKVAAPSIASDISEKNGWRVGRTALRLRNPGNAPDEWERKVLERFSEQLEQEADPEKLEHFEVVEENEVSNFRFMKAIPLAKPCLTCHGPAVEPSLYEEIKKLYPSDQAVGFELGSLRGAFSVSQPMK
jgi:hypothetical protein